MEKEINLKFQSYLSVYKYKDIGDDNYSLGGTACFATASFYGDNKKTREYRVYTIRNKENYEAGKNFCPFTINEIRNHLKQFQDVYKFNYRVREIKPEDINGLKADTEIYIKVSGRWKQHLLVLTWLRYIYEFPYNYSLLEAKRMQKLEDYRFDSVINLFLCTIGAIREYGDIHDFVRFTKFKTKRQLKDSAKKLTSVDALYKGDSIVHDSNLQEVYSTRNWKYNNFLDRLPEYEKLYKLFK